MTHLKVTGGSLKVKSLVNNRKNAGDGEVFWEEKADQIRIYDGQQYQLAEEVQAGEICTVTGLEKTFAGEGAGRRRENAKPLLTPVMDTGWFIPKA